MRLRADTFVAIRRDRRKAVFAFLGAKMDKPFKTIQEQIEILEDRGLRVGPDAARILEREGYYPVVNGYKDPFLQTLPDGGRKDEFESGVTFSDLYTLFCFDRALRMAMFSFFARAEATFKTVCSYEFAKRHPDEGDAYLNLDSYADDARTQARAAELIEDFGKIIGYQEDGNLRTKRQYIIHYVLNHDCVPIWVLANYLSLGQIFKFYCFQKESVRNDIAKSFSRIYEETHRSRLTISHRRLRLAFDHIKDFRNICAHDERLYCARVSPSKDTRLLGVMSDLSIVLTKKDTEQMVQQVMKLMLGLGGALGPTYSKKVFDAMGVPEVQRLMALVEEV